MKTFVMGGIAAASFSRRRRSHRRDRRPVQARKSRFRMPKQVEKAQANLDAAKEKRKRAWPRPTKRSGKKPRRSSRAWWPSGNGSKEIATQKDSLKQLDARAVKSSDDRDDVESARAKLVVAQSKLDVIKSRLRNGPDDSSQAIQPENRTQNGAGFSVRSERDAENHPPLPASQ